MTVAIKRIYEPAARGDGTRVLVDRLWPRGLSQANAKVDEWLRALAPSDTLRHSYHAEMGTAQTADAQSRSWSAFRAKYLKELSRPESQEALLRLYALANRKKRLTLLYASRNETHNNATVLKELLEGQRKPPKGTGPGAFSDSRRRTAAARRR
jgi:uncharacterized protein YeaO (DUF488 family)